MRDRLIELFEEMDKNPEITCPCPDDIDSCKGCQYAIGKNGWLCDLNARKVDYLLANGVIIPPCKVGDTVYVKWRLTKASKYGIYPAKVYALRWDEKKNNFRACVEGDFKISAYGGEYTHYYRATFAWDNVGKTVFLTKEEAEQALKEREQ